MSIKQAFRDLSKAFHPDLGGDTKSMQALNELYEAAKSGDSRHVQSATKTADKVVSRSAQPDFVTASQRMALIRTASEIDLNMKQVERMHDDQYNDYIANMNHQAQAVYYAALADVLEEQREASMAAQATAQNKMYEARAQDSRAAQKARAAQVRANGGQWIRSDGMWITEDGSYCCDSDLSDGGVFS